MDRLPPELMAMLGAPGAPLPPGAVPMPPPDPMAPPMADPMGDPSMMWASQPRDDIDMGMMGGDPGMFGETPAVPPPAPDPFAQQMMTPPDVAPGDPALMQILSQAPQMLTLPVDPRIARRKKRFAGMAKPDMGQVREYANEDQRAHQHLLARFARDIGLYRQHESARPPGFSMKTDVPFVGSGMSNVVNKLANMLAAIDVIIESPFRDEATKDQSQIIEDFGYWVRDYEKDMYTRSGGSILQWDEFFYLLLHGRLCCRVLPDARDEEYPFRTALLDPATCYPYFGDDKDGMLRMTRVYQDTVGGVLSDYGAGDPDLQRRMARQLGYGIDDVQAYLRHRLKVVEYWDPMYRAVIAGDIDILPITEHGYGFVPFIYVSARGEPKGMQTPEGVWAGDPDEFGNTGYAASREIDVAEKGVSVFHHLVNTHRLKEVLHTVLIMEAIKAQNPPTVTYTAPQLAGEEPPPLNNKPGGNNQRVLNLQKIEGIPTSPRPTDVAPVANHLAEDWAQGTIPPHVFGAEQGSNVSGFAVESLIAAAKDAILPYTHAFEVYLGLKLEMQLKLYQEYVGPTVTLHIPSKSGTRYGMTPLKDLTPQVIDSVGPRVRVKLHGISQQNLPGQMATAVQGIQGGVWSVRRGMEHLGEKDPDRMFQDIVAERAVQHPEVMENFLIPQFLSNRGDDELMKIWMQMVVMPKLGQMMGAAPPGADPAMAQQQGAPPDPNGQSAPMMGAEPPPPGGPEPGQGRGPVM